MERFVLAALIGYVLGSIPTAYLVVRWKSRLDIRTAGSGNVGTYNAFDVTKSKTVAGLVLLVDFAKGLAAVLLTRRLFGGDPDPGWLAALAAIAGHNYPVWLHGKGGRGLATAAGGAFLTFWGLIPAWVAFWAVAFVLVKEINAANVVACALSAAIVVVSPTLLPGAGGLTVIPPGGYAVLMMGLILLRLIEPVRSYLDDRKRRRSGQ